MRDYSVETSPQVYARIGGLLYLLIIILGMFGEVFARGRIVVSGDAAATAANLASMESLWRLSVAAEFISLICTTALAMVYFFLLRPVSKELNLLSIFFMLIAIAVEASSSLNLVTALFPLGNGASLRAFTPEQLYTMASLAIKAHSYGFGLALIFVGCHFLIHGYLIFRSGYLPKVLGILMQVSGVGYLTNSFTLILYPAVANRLFMVIMLPVFVGEASLCLWLLFKGVNVRRWNERLRMNAAGSTTLPSTGTTA